MGFGGKAVIAVLIVAVLGGAVWAMGPQAGTASDAPDRGTDATPSPTSEETGAESTDATERQDTDSDGSSGAAPPTDDDTAEGRTSGGADAGADGGDGSDADGDADSSSGGDGDGDDGSSSGGDSGASDGSGSSASGSNGDDDEGSDGDTSGGAGTTDETSLAVGSTSVAADGTAQIRLTLEAAPDGMAGFRTQIAVDTAVATVESATPADELDRISTVDVAEDGSSVTVEAVDDDRLTEPGATDVHLATITVGGVDAGTTPLDLTSERFDDENGTAIDVTTTNGEVDVESTGSDDR